MKLNFVLKKFHLEIHFEKLLKSNLTKANSVGMKTIQPEFDKYNKVIM